jgi:hypothetical protein
MRLLKAVAASLAALAAAAFAAPASAAVSGYIEGSYEHNSVDFNNSGSEDNNTFALGGAVVDSFSNGWNVQADGQTNDVSWQNSSADDAQGYTAVHAFMRNDDYALGGFVGLASIYDYSVRMLGVEGQMYLPDVTLGAALNYAETDTGYYGNVTSWGAGGEVNYFVNDNLALTGKAAYTSFDLGNYYCECNDNSADEWSVGIGGEFQMDKSPVSVFAAYTYTNLDGPSSYGFDDNTIKIGVRLNLGTTTLRDRTNKGASMDGAQGVYDAWRNGYID